jgi:hypothetical protein
LPAGLLISKRVPETLNISFHFFCDRTKKECESE